jgi:hypothetical protein
VGLPGLRARGFQVEEGPTGRTEHETYTCAHCGAVTLVPHRAEPHELGRLCHPCNQMLCPQCSQNPECTPLVKRIDTALRRDALFRALG